jgi:hypothetical protein
VLVGQPVRVVFPETTEARTHQTYDLLNSIHVTPARELNRGHSPKNLSLTVVQSSETENNAAGVTAILRTSGYTELESRESSEAEQQTTITCRRGYHRDVEHSHA